MKKRDITKYRNGGQGFAEFCEDFCYAPIYPPGESVPSWVSMKELPDDPHPVTGKSYKSMWEEQKKICLEALKMENGEFTYRLIVFCWMRGEGKSFLCCLIQLWKFILFPRQQIMLGANSKDQVKFVHFDILRDLIVNSPRLLRWVGGKRNVQEKEIRLKDDENNIRSIIRSISSFSGIVSNITGYTFSEIFDMKNPKFFVQLDGSIRGVPNAIGTIDSTVSTKTHILFKLYSEYKSGNLKTCFFSYRCSNTGHSDDYWNPNMTKDQLDDYRVKFPFGEFERYFLNLWSAGTNKPFTDEMIRELGIIALDGNYLDHLNTKRVLEEIANKESMQDTMLGKGLPEVSIEIGEKIAQLKSRFTSVDELYILKNIYNEPGIISIEDVDKLSDLFDTDWVLLAGTDFDDPMSVRSNARSIFTAVLKGLPGSRSTPFYGDHAILKYIYFVICVKNIESKSNDECKEILEELHNNFNGVDVLCTERYGAWDFSKWCDEKDISFEAIFPTYDKQREAFKEIFTVFAEGRIKSPKIWVPGSKSEDILREEANIFDHDIEKRWFGSPEKKETKGIQDDCMYSLAWCIYGGRNLGPDDFSPRKSKPFFGNFIPNEELIATY